MNTQDDDPERGGALVAVIIAIVIIYTLFGSLALAVMAQNRLVMRDHLRRQAMYTAEAGVYAALLQMDKGKVLSGTLSALDGDSAAIDIRPHGAYYLATSTATAGGQSAQAVALVGVDPGPLREVAIGAMGTGLVLGGNARIQGAIRAGGEVETGIFGMRPFRGIFNGTTLLGAGETPPSFALYDHLLDQVLHQHVGGIAPGLPLRIVEGDLSISVADSASFRTPVVVFTTGRLTISGPLSFATGSAFVALDTLDIVGAVRGEHGLFVSGQTVRIGASVLCSGQFIGRWGAQTLLGATLRYPSVLYAQGAGLRQGAGVMVRSGAVVEGSVISAWGQEGTSQDPAITIEAGAHVRGAVLSSGPVDLRGTVEGSVLAGEFVVFDGYSTYHNWIVDASVALDQRPEGFALPVPSSALPSWSRRHVITAWMHL